MVGETIGGYRITGKLGEGGMGVVYLGQHQRIARKAAIKVLLSDFSKNQDVVDRFFREAMATSRIHHPGIVEVTDCDLLQNGCAYIIMELLEGESLGAHLRRHGRLSVQQAVYLARHIADALAAAHDEKIVHRDLKPDNVFVLTTRPSGSVQPIKVVDFGIAKLLNTESGNDHKKTRTGSIIGTPIYMSPEQCRGTGEIDHRTDIYSLGCIIFEMLTARPPFTHEGFGELIQSHLGVVPQTLRSIDPAFPPAIDALVARMLAKAPGERPQTMRALIAELDAIAANELAMTAAIATVPPAARRFPAEPQMTAEMPRAETTLKSASAEKMEVFSTDEHLAIGRPRRRGPMVGVALAVVVAGGIGIWRASTSTPTSPPDSVASAPAPAATPPGAPRPAAPTSPVKAPLRPAMPLAPATQPRAPADVAVPAPSAKQAPAHKTAAAEAPAKSEKAPKGSSPHRVHVTISTVPSGADVCLASDRLLLGKTAFDWTSERGARTVKFLLRKPGYRGQELSVSTDGDAKHRVELDKLGRDDIDDVTNCKPR